MLKKFFYENVKQVFKDRGYTLISKEYINSRTKLGYECPKGHLGSMTYSHFQQGSSCPVCSIENSKLSYEEVKRAFDDRSYTLLSKEYTNKTIKLDYECPKGHLGSMTYGNFQQGNSCPVCSIENSKFSYDDVKKVFRDRGYILRSKEYVNSQTKLDYECPKGHLGSMTYGNFYQKHACLVCFIENSRLSYEEVKRAFDDRGYTLLSKEYVNVQTKLDYICPKGHLGSMTYGNFHQGKGCPICNIENSKLSYEEVKRAFDGRGYTLLSKEYVNAGAKLDYRCPKGHLGSMIYSHFQQGSDCPICSDSSPVSKISQKWLASLGLSSEMGISREVSLKIGDNRFKVDGFDLSTNTVYEFLGDYWHGNPSVFDPNEVNKNNKKTFGRLYQETLERIHLLEEAEYNVVYIWEKDFLEGKGCCS